MRGKQNAARGFTLIEILVVIAIIAAIVAAVAPTAFKAPDRARVSGALADYGAVKTATMNYFADTSAWPATGATGVGFVSTDSVAGWDGPYLDRFPTKAKWGTGVNAYKKDAVQDWNAVAVGEEGRYFEITAVPSASAIAIDGRIDPAVSGILGAVRYAAGATTTVRILISTDVAVD